MGVRLTPAEIRQLCSLRREGYTLDKIAEMTGKSKGVVCKYTKGMIKQSPCSGCPNAEWGCTKTDDCPDWFGWFSTEWVKTCEKLRRCVM